MGRLEPIRRIARTIRRYHAPSVTHFAHPITNAAAEGLSAAIHRIKGME